MTEEPIPIDVSELDDLLAGSQEFIRFWAKDGGSATCLIDPYVVGPDPFAFGIAIVDCVRHGANAYGQALGISAEEALSRIWEGLDAERAHPTDGVTQIVPKKEIN